MTTLLTAQSQGGGAHGQPQNIPSAVKSHNQSAQRTPLGSTPTMQQRAPPTSNDMVSSTNLPPPFSSMAPGSVPLTPALPATVGGAPTSMPLGTPNIYAKLPQSGNLPPSNMLGSAVMRPAPGPTATRSPNAFPPATPGPLLPATQPLLGSEYFLASHQLPPSMRATPNQSAAASVAPQMMHLPPRSGGGGLPSSVPMAPNTMPLLYSAGSPAPVSMTSRGMPSMGPPSPAPPPKQGGAIAASPGGVPAVGGDLSYSGGSGGGGRGPMLPNSLPTDSLQVRGLPPQPQQSFTGSSAIPPLRRPSMPLTSSRSPAGATPETEGMHRRDNSEEEAKDPAVRPEDQGFRPSSPKARQELVMPAGMIRASGSKVDGELSKPLVSARQSSHAHRGSGNSDDALGISRRPSAMAELEEMNVKTPGGAGFDNVTSILDSFTARMRNKMDSIYNLLDENNCDVSPELMPHSLEGLDVPSLPTNLGRMSFHRKGTGQSYVTSDELSERGYSEFAKLPHRSLASMASKSFLADESAYSDDDNFPDLDLQLPDDAQAISTGHLLEQIKREQQLKKMNDMAGQVGAEVMGINQRGGTRALAGSAEAQQCEDIISVNSDVFPGRSSLMASPASSKCATDCGLRVRPLLLEPALALMVPRRPRGIKKPRPRPPANQRETGQSNAHLAVDIMAKEISGILARIKAEVCA
eukprot:GHVU01040019.1.p1 GENE.GHVU01040019.1~~GHVU01040019.1.p1  ORF type:complete len:694 (+),score=91.02 GHVU01040019.1:188-2269(+)